MSSFFTTPASQKKRKREDISAAPFAKKKRHPNGSGSTPAIKKPAKAQRDESISGSGSEDNEDVVRASEESLSSDGESESGGETGAQRRLRLAEQYLENIKSEVETVGFDAEDIDRDLIAERLKEDVAATKGKLYRHITSSFDFSNASKTSFRMGGQTTTSIAICPPYIYTVSKDMTLIKWELPTPPVPPPRMSKARDLSKKPPPPRRRRPIQLIHTHGSQHESHNSKYMHHTASILTVAASQDGKYVATGGADKRLIIWSATDLKPLRVFTQHRDAVTSLAFRKGTNQLYSSSKDRTIKSWSLDELGYMETLFGHQDEVVDVAALAMERCVSVGARDRTARLWKVVEESQLVFRGGGGGTEKRKHRDKAHGNLTNGNVQISYAEGSIDRVAMVDEETFITGSDNGDISLWSMHKKKPVFTVALAHGLDPPLTQEEASAEMVPNDNIWGEPQPRWITALAAVPYSDLVLSGSWDGRVRVWRVSEDKKRIEAMGILGKESDVGHAENGDATSGITTSHREEAEHRGVVDGIINDIALFESGERGGDGLCVVIALGKEHRFGRWKKVKGKNGAAVFLVPRGALQPATNGVHTMRSEGGAKRIEDGQRGNDRDLLQESHG
ncbi:MAG: hypothetical protein Q9174_000021 [Haloplaca sp. 1 TL-2023]